MKPLFATHLNLVGGELSSENLEKAMEAFKAILASNKPVEMVKHPIWFIRPKLAEYQED